MLELGGLQRFWGCCATRGGVLPNAAFADSSTYMMRTYHYARGAPIIAIRVLWGNFYVPNDDAGGETNSGSSKTIEASIEYPSGTFHRLLFNNGSTTATMASGGQQWSDVLWVNIPVGPKFFVRCRHSGATQYVYNDFPLMDVAGGDALSQTATNQVMTGTITDSSFGIPYYPLLIVGYTTARSAIIFGDSRQSGIGETSTSTGDCGEVARTIGGAMNYASYGIQGQSAAFFNTHSTKQIALAKYFTHVVFALGANDLGTAAGVETELATLAAKVRPRRVIVPTLPPGLGTTERTSLNDYYRGMPLEISGVIEVADVMETARNSGTWKSGYAPDGIHESTTANLNMVGTPTAMFCPGAGAAGYMPRIVVP